MTLRGLQFWALDETAIIQHGTIISDGGGGGTAAWLAAGTVPCRIDPLLAGGEEVVASRLDDRSTHRITTPAETDVQSVHRVVISGRGTYEVTAVHDRTDERTKVFEAVEVS